MSIRAVKKGLTLIELSVTIVVVAVLLLTTLISVKKVYAQTSDDLIRNDFSIIQSSADSVSSTMGHIYNNTGSKVTNSCRPMEGTIFANASIQNALAHAAIESDIINPTPQCGVAADGSTYVILSGLLKDERKYWCIDSLGHAKFEDVILGANITSCP